MGKLPPGLAAYMAKKKSGNVTPTKKRGKVFPKVALDKHPPMKSSMSSLSFYGKSKVKK